MNDEPDPIIDPSSHSWIEKARSLTEPFGAARSEDKGVWMISYAMNEKFEITDKILKNGHLGWRMVNTEARPRRIFRLHGTITKNRVKYNKADCDEIDENNPDTEFNLNWKLKGREPNETFSPIEDRTVSLEVISDGKVTLKSSALSKELASPFWVGVKKPTESEITKGNPKIETSQSPNKMNLPPQIDGIIQAANCDQTDCAGDVVFVHGLQGDGYKTWHPENNANAYWPTLLGNDLTDLRIWSLQYDASITHWFGGQAMALTDRALEILNRLTAQGLGDRPLVFVTHSLGGLVIKQILRTAQDNGCSNSDWYAILENTKGIVFLSTPHHGSKCVDWVNYFKYFVRSTAVMDDLTKYNNSLSDLNRWYRANSTAIGITTQVYYEKQDTKNVRVVDQQSADPGITGVVPIPIDANHTSISKAANTTNSVYVGVRNFISNTIRHSTSSK